jgi:hypothetical protein
MSLENIINNNSGINSTQTAIEDIEKAITDTERTASEPITKKGTNISSTEPYSVFSKHKKLVIVIICCLTGIVSPLSANIYLPALNAIQQVKQQHTNL